MAQVEGSGVATPLNLHLKDWTAIIILSDQACFHTGWTQSRQAARVTKTRFAQRGGSPDSLPSIQVSPMARQLGPGLGPTSPPPAMVFPFISQIEVWPLVF